MYFIRIALYDMQEENIRLTTCNGIGVPCQKNKKESKCWDRFYSFCEKTWEICGFYLSIAFGYDNMKSGRSSFAAVAFLDKA